MKINSSDISKIIQLITSGKASGILLHGPNFGMSNAIISKIISSSNYLVSRFVFNEITAQTIAMKLQERNFFNQKEFIKIYNIPTSINNDLKQVLKKDNTENIICFISEESLPPSGIRKIFEDEKHLIAVACYEEDESSISSAVIKKITSAGQKIEEDALLYIKKHISGDRQIAASEISKLLDYTHDKNIITLKDVAEAINIDLTAKGEEMCMYFALGRMNDFLNEVSNLKTQGINEVLIIRALIRFYMNLYYASLYVEDGLSADMSLKKISPPIFFKMIPVYKTLLKNTSSSDSAIVIEHLLKAEVYYKTNPAGFDLYNILLPISSSRD